MKKVNNKNILYYLIVLVVGSLIMLYLFYKDPGLFPFSILFDGFIVLIINLVIGAISLIASYVISLLFGEKNNKRNRFISFTTIYIILYLLYVLKRFI